jgi:hypothetical protein
MIDKRDGTSKKAPEGAPPFFPNKPTGPARGDVQNSQRQRGNVPFPGE